MLSLFCQRANAYAGSKKSRVEESTSQILKKHLQEFSEIELRIPCSARVLIADRFFQDHGAITIRLVPGGINAREPHITQKIKLGLKGLKLCNIVALHKARDDARLRLASRKDAMCFLRRRVSVSPDAFIVACDLERYEGKSRKNTSLECYLVRTSECGNGTGRSVAKIDEIRRFSKKKCDSRNFQRPLIQAEDHSNTSKRGQYHSVSGVCGNSVPILER